MRTRDIGAVVLAAGILLPGCWRVRTWVGGSVRRGTTVFAEKGCYGCHTMGAAGTPIAPDLQHIGAKYTRDYLAVWLRDPTMFCPSHMPRIDMTEGQLQDLADYLASLR